MSFGENPLSAYLRQKSLENNIIENIASQYKQFFIIKVYQGYYSGTVIASETKWSAANRINAI